MALTYFLSYLGLRIFIFQALIFFIFFFKFSRKISPFYEYNGAKLKLKFHSLSQFMASLRRYVIMYKFKFTKSIKKWEGGRRIGKKYNKKLIVALDDDVDRKYLFVLCRL